MADGAAPVSMPVVAAVSTSETSEATVERAGSAAVSSAEPVGATVAEITALKALASELAGADSLGTGPVVWASVSSGRIAASARTK